MNEHDKNELADFFRQFSRNFRWGTCGECPRDSNKNVYPEFCVNTTRYDHQLNLTQLCEVFKLMTKNESRGNTE